MTREDVYEMIAKYFSEQFEIEKEKITLSARLYQDLGLDSIDALDMVSMLESQYDFDVKKEELKKIRTVADVIDYMLLKLEITE